MKEDMIKHLGQLQTRMVEYMGHIGRLLHFSDFYITLTVNGKFLQLPAKNWADCHLTE